MRIGAWTVFTLCFGALPLSHAAEITPGVPIRDQYPGLFTRTAMPGVPRSIGIPLTSNVHVAFDARLLRIHTAWMGKPVKLAGYVTGGNSDALSKINGDILWQTPAECPWTVVEPAHQPTNHFRGISTKSGHATLLYDVGDQRGLIRVHETPRARPLGSNVLVERRFEIAPHVQRLQFQAAPATGDIVFTNQTTVALRGANHLMFIHHQGTGTLRFGRSSNALNDVSVLLPASDVATTFIVSIGVLPTNTATGPILNELKHSPAPAPDLTSAYRIESKRCEWRALEFAGVTKGGRIDGNEFYRREQVPIPRELDLLVGGLDWLPNGDLAVATWPGEIYIAGGITNSLTNITWRRFAAGLDEPLGLRWINGHAYVATKPELTRITDTDGDGEADLFETVSDAWGFDGDVHYFAYGPACDDAGNFYVPLDGNTGDWHAKWQVPFRGWTLKINPDGLTEPVMAGLRTPNGIFSYGGDIFCTDNEGYWIGTCKINHCRPGRFYGYPSSMPQAHEGFDHPSRFDPPAIWFPRKLCTSASGADTVRDLRFGAFNGQLLVGDFGTASLLRVGMEKVNGEWQGAVWPFMKGFLSGVNRVSYGPDGCIYAGSLRRGWSSAGPLEFALERIRFTGREPFEIEEVHATPGGFDLTFTEPAGPGATNTNAWAARQYGYIYHGKYGSPEIDHTGKENSATALNVVSVSVSSNRKVAHLQIDGLKPGYVTAITANDVHSAAGSLLWHDTFYYTLNQIPKSR